MKQFGKLLLTGLMLIGSACTALAQDANPVKDKDKNKASVAYIGKGDGITTCPVSGNPIKKEFKGEAMGREFHACCESCVATVKKSPEAYLKPLPKKQNRLAGQKRRR